MRILTVDNLSYNLDKLPETVSEDMAEVYSHIIYLDAEKIKQIRNLDENLNKKISYIKSKIKEIDNSFVF